MSSKELCTSISRSKSKDVKRSSFLMEDIYSRVRALQAFLYINSTPGTTQRCGVSRSIQHISGPLPGWKTIQALFHQGMTSMFATGDLMQQPSMRNLSMNHFNSKTSTLLMFKLLSLTMTNIPSSSPAVLTR